MSKPQSQQKSQDVGHVDLAAMKDSVEKSVTKRSAPRRRSDAATGAKKQQQPPKGAAAAEGTAIPISTGVDASSGGGGLGSFQPQQHPEKEVVVTPRAPVRVVVTPEKQQLPIGGELHSRSGDPTPVKWRQHATATTTAPPGPLPAMISSLSSQHKEQQHQASFVSVNGTDMGAPLLIRPPAVTAMSRLSQRTLTQQEEQQQQTGSHQASKLSAASEPKSDQSGSRTLGADPIVFQASTALPPVVRMTDNVRSVVAPVPKTIHPAPGAQTRKSDQVQAPSGEGVRLGPVKPSADAATEAKAGASAGAAQKQEQHQQHDSGVKQRQPPVRPKPLGLEALGLVTTPRSSQPATAMPVGRSAAAAAAMQRSSAYPRATTQPLPQRAAAHTHIPPAAAATHAAQPKQQQQQQAARADADKLQASSGTVIPVPPPGPPPVIKEISPAKPSMNSAAALPQRGAQPRVMHRRVDSLQQELLAAPQTTYLPQQQQIEFTRAPAAHYLTPVASIGLDESLSRATTAMQLAAAPNMVFSPLSSMEQQLQGQQLAAPEVWWAHRQEPEFAVAQQPASVEQQPAVYYEQQPQVDQRWVEYAPQPQPQMPEQQFIQQPQLQYQSQQSQQQPTYNMNTGQAILNYSDNNNAAAAAMFGSNEMTTYYPPPVYDPYSQQQQQQQPQYVVQPPVYYDVAPAASYYNAGASTAGAYYAPASASGGAMVDGFVWNM